MRHAHAVTSLPPPPSPLPPVFARLRTTFAVWETGLTSLGTDSSYNGGRYDNPLAAAAAAAATTAATAAAVHALPRGREHEARYEIDVEARARAAARGLGLPPPPALPPALALPRPGSHPPHSYAHPHHGPHQTHNAHHSEPPELADLTEFHDGGGGGGGNGGGGDNDAPRYSRAVTANEVVGIQRRRHLEGVEAQAPARQPTRPPEEPARLPEGVSGLNIQLDGANGAPIIEQLAEAIAAHYGRVIEVPTPRACPPPGCTYYGCTCCGCTYYGCT